MDALQVPLSFEQRESMKVLVLVRWVLLGALLLLIDYPLRADPGAAVFIAVLMLLALVVNGLLQWLLSREKQIPAAIPIGVGVFDAAAITGAIYVFDRFDNGGYLIYYPALLGFAAFVRGRIGITYSIAIMAIYTLLSISSPKQFDRGSASDWHELGLRLISMMVVVLMAYLLVRVERQRRLRAVAAEAARQREVASLEDHARALERQAEEERGRLLRGIHDGVSQGVYLLSLGLEAAADDLAQRGLTGTEAERLQALARLSKRTLLDTRGLLIDLTSVMGGKTRLDVMLRQQADEFSAVTGIPVTLVSSAASGTQSAATVAEVYRLTQESLANVYRHSGASCVRIELSETPEGTTLTISDNGVGFKPAETTGRGHGLRSMQERADILGARLIITSAVGHGSSVQLTIPGITGTHSEDARGDTRPAGR